MSEDAVYVLIKVISGDLVVGSLNVDLASMVRDKSKIEVICIKDPISITYNQSGDVVLRKWNVFSKLNTVMIQPNTIVYTDVPSDVLLEQYVQMTTKQPDADSTLH